jgi:hypothetical protein
MSKRYVEFKPFFAATGWVVIAQYDIDHFGLIAADYPDEESAQIVATKLNRAMQ